MELTDLHNRRANIETVAALAKAHGYPLLTWPEDKELLRLSDLPRLVYINKPINWVTITPYIHFILRTDQALRDVLIIGRAYSINPALGDFNDGWFVQEFKVITR